MNVSVSFSHKSTSPLPTHKTKKKKAGNVTVHLSRVYLASTETEHHETKF